MWLITSRSSTDVYVADEVSGLPFSLRSSHAITRGQRRDSDDGPAPWCSSCGARRSHSTHCFAKLSSGTELQILTSTLFCLSWCPSGSSCHPALSTASASHRTKLLKMEHLASPCIPLHTQ